MLGLLLLIAAATYLGYRLFPEPLFDLAARLQRRAAGLERREITVDGHRVIYLEGGQGEPLLLLHGFGADKDHWSQISKHLTPHFRVIVPDLPGFGESSRLSDARYDLEQQLTRLGQFVAGLGLARFHLGGNSMGGYLAAMYAQHAPDSVLSLWLLAPAGVGSAAPSEFLAMLARGDNLLLVDSEVTAKRLYGMLFAKAPFLPGEFRRIWRHRAMRDCEFNTKIFNELFAEPVTLESRLEGLATPAFIVWGDDDRVLDVSGAAVLKKLLPNATIRIMPYMGHCPMLERPRNTAIDFLNYHGRALL